MPRTPLERISLSFNFDLNFAKKMPLDFKYRKYNYINRLSQASDWKSLYKVNGMTLEVENFADLLAYVENLALFTRILSDLSELLDFFQLLFG